MSARVIWDEMTTLEQNTLIQNLMRETQVNFAKKNLPLPVGWHLELIAMAKRRSWYRHADGTVRIKRD